MSHVTGTCVAQLERAGHVRACLAILTATLLASLVSPVSADDPFFLGLGGLPGDRFSSQAWAVSADGNVVVGRSTAGFGSLARGEAFRWTRTGGMFGLGYLPADRPRSSAASISADGTVIVGHSRSAAMGGNREAFRWTAATGLVGLGDLPGGAAGSEAVGISADGAVIVGASSSTRSGIVRPEAFRWTAASGMVGLGDLSAGLFYSAATAASADGTVIVGGGNSAAGFEAFRWTAQSGMVGLGDLPGGDFISIASAVTPDGNVIVGLARSERSAATNDPEAFRWTAADGMLGLGDLAGGDFDSRAYAVSADGSIVVGRSHIGPQRGDDRAFIWDARHGMRNLGDTLVAKYGLDLTGWKLYRANGVSADGLTIVGRGFNPAGVREAWIAHIPEPATASLLLITALAVMRLGRRR